MSSKLRRTNNQTGIIVPRGFDIPNKQHQKILRSGVETWNRWREENPNIRPKLGYTCLRRVDLSGFNFDNAYLPFSTLSRCNLKRASFRSADLRGASLRRADLTNANLDRSVLRHVSLAECVVNDAVFTDCEIYGISAWNLLGEPKNQSNMIIRATSEEPGITVDDLEVAQLIFLLLNNPKIRNVIDIVTSKSVLILGRFSPERKIVLDSLRDELRNRNYLPIIFDFEKPADRDFTETVMTLAGMSKFIIADLTQPKSSPLESHATITSYMIPFIPIIQEGEWPFAMFVDLQRKHHWVFNTLKYKDKDDLLQWVDKIIAKADAKYREIQLEKAQAAQQPVSGDDW